MTATLPLSAQSSAKAVPSPARKFALLIGIDTYEAPGVPIHRPEGAPASGRFAGGIVFPDLHGPQYDLANMRALLVSPKFGFANDSQHIHTLKDQAATRKGILEAINAYVVDQPKRGDTVIFYMSGHGSLRVNSLGNGQSFDADGSGKKNILLEGTVVTSDGYLGVEDITSRELRRLFNRAADKGIHLTAIFDTCHSGGQARGAGGPGMVPRAVAFDPRDMLAAPDINTDGTAVVAPQDRKDTPVLVFSAAQRDQMAIDVKDGDPPHGLFTNALIAALQALPVTAAAADVYRQVLVNIEHTPGAGDQHPALDSTATRRLQPLFGGEAAQGPAHAAVAEVGKDGTILIDIGPAADIGAGSELTAVTARDGVKAVLRVKEAVSLSRSSAEVLSPAHATVQLGDILEVTRWMRSPSSAATFFAGPRNISRAQILGALDAVRQAQITLVHDPSADPWTHLIFWNGVSWMLQPHDDRTLVQSARTRTPAVSLGAVLSASSLAARLPAKATLWFDPPLPAEMSTGLLKDSGSAAELATNRDAALYVIAGIPAPGGVQYAWYHRIGFDSQQQTPAGYGAGCSAFSSYPLRSDWISLDDGSHTVGSATAQLNKYASRLTRLAGWLELQSSVSGAGSFPYSLTLQRSADSVLMKDDDDTYRGQHYSLALTGDIDANIEHPRWVYVLGIDCQGNGKLLWPNDGPGGKFPAADGVRREFMPLANSAFHIDTPFGPDTFLMVTTSTPLPDPDVLNFDASVTRGARGGGHGATGRLEELLSNTSAGTRGFGGDTPTDWSVQMLRTHSHPAAPSPPVPSTPNR